MTNTFYENIKKKWCSNSFSGIVYRLRIQMVLSTILYYLFEHASNMLKTCLNYSGRFPEGVQKEEIQQWRQAQSRPGEKETLNICWGNKTMNHLPYNVGLDIFQVFYALNIMLRVSFSPDRDRACRYCWICSFRPPLRKNGYHILRKEPFRH